MTVADLIRRSLKVLGVLAAGEAPEAEELTDAFDSLNRMLDSWANEQLWAYAVIRSSYTLTAGLNPHTIGTGGTFNTTRPVRIERASIVLSSSSSAELPLVIVSDAEWQNTQGKTTTGLPAYLWPETTYPLVNLWLNPIPAAADHLVLYTWQQIVRFSATSDTIALPPGYEDALMFNLAKRLAPEFGVALPAEAADVANETKADLKRLNDKPIYLRSDPALLRRGAFNIISGDRG